MPDIERDPERPARVELCDAHLDGAATRRLMVILRAPGCRYQQRTAGCTNCGFDRLTTNDGIDVSTEQLLAQLDHALGRIDPAQTHDVRQLDLYNSGSFFEDTEIPPAARPRLLQLACARLPALQRVVVESRPELITLDRLDSCLSALAENTRLEVAIGLESVDPSIREQKIKKGFTLAAFERACARLAARSVGVLVYLLLKPIDTGEQAAIDDVVASARHVTALSKRLSLALRIALEPTFVVEGTPLHRAWLQGSYRPPSLWSVVEVLQAIAPLAPIKVGLSDEGLPARQRPSGCQRCTPGLLSALRRFNRTQDLSVFDALACPDCRR